MATAHHYSCIEQIGDTAGLVWHQLNESGPRTLTQLTKDIDAPATSSCRPSAGWLGKTS